MLASDGMVHERVRLGYSTFLNLAP